MLLYLPSRTNITGTKMLTEHIQFLEPPRRQRKINEIATTFSYNMDTKNNKEYTNIIKL